MVSSVGTEETTETVTTYLHKAFGFEDVFLALVHRDDGDARGHVDAQERPGATPRSRSASRSSASPRACSRAASGSTAPFTIHDARLHPPFDAPPDTTLGDVIEAVQGYTARAAAAQPHALRLGAGQRGVRPRVPVRPAGPGLVVRAAARRERRLARPAGPDAAALPRLPAVPDPRRARRRHAPRAGPRRASRPRCSSRSRCRSRRWSRTRASTTSCATASASASTCSTRCRTRSR